MCVYNVLKVICDDIGSMIENIQISTIIICIIYKGVKEKQNKTKRWKKKQNERQNERNIRQDTKILKESI